MKQSKRRFRGSSGCEVCSKNLVLEVDGQPCGLFSLNLCGAPVPFPYKFRYTHGKTGYMIVLPSKPTEYPRKYPSSNGAHALVVLCVATKRLTFGGFVHPVRRTFQTGCTYNATRSGRTLRSASRTSAFFRSGPSL